MEKGDSLQVRVIFLIYVLNNIHYQIFYYVFVTACYQISYKVASKLLFKLLAVDVLIF